MCLENENDENESVGVAWSYGIIKTCGTPETSALHSNYSLSHRTMTHMLSDEPRLIASSTRNLAIFFFLFVRTVLIIFLIELKSKSMVVGAWEGTVREKVARIHPTDTAGIGLTCRQSESCSSQ